MELIIASAKTPPSRILAFGMRISLACNREFIYEPTLKHATICIICYGVDMRWHFMSLLPTIHIDHFVSVNRQAFVRVHDHTEKT